LPTTTTTTSFNKPIILGCDAARCPERRYWGVTLKELASTAHTHVAIEGLVTVARKEPDGDIHIRLEDGTGAFAIGEMIPSLLQVRPKVGQRVRLFGISRYDRKHKWGEVHPVEAWEPIR
jgi:hypothetical protein